VKFLALLIPAFAITAHAQSVIVQPIRVLGTEIASAEYTNRVMQATKAEYKSQLKIDLAFMPLRSLIPPFRDQTTLANREQQFRKLKGWFARRGLADRSVIKFAAVPPAMEGQVKYLYGYADRIGSYGRGNPIASAALVEYSASGANRFAHSVTAAMHEIAHTLGANHSTGAMDANALAFVTNAPLKFTPLSSSQINVYLYAVRRRA